jgi:L-aminopeptidase/D-esterase-like protein
MTTKRLPVRIGHWTGLGTGVTVVLAPEGTVGSGEVRGGSPATREFDLLDPNRLINRIDAVVLSGGSAFGLAAADGVMTYLRERNAGHPTPCGPVPIVPGMSIFDDSVASRPPDAAAGYAAAAAAVAEPPAMGEVGAGAGAASGKWLGRRCPGGIGWSVRASGDVLVTALAIVNAWGDIIDTGGKPVNVTAPTAAHDSDAPLLNTTLVVLATDAVLTKSNCLLVAQSCHDGFAKALHPAHSRYDGDAVVALATGAAGPADLDRLRVAATEVTSDAIRAAAVR